MPHTLKTAGLTHCCKPYSPVHDQEHGRHNGRQNNRRDHSTGHVNTGRNVGQWPDLVCSTHKLLWPHYANQSLPRYTSTRNNRVHVCVWVCIWLYLFICMYVCVHAKQSMRGYLKGMPDKVMFPDSFALGHKD